MVAKYNQKPLPLVAKLSHLAIALIIFAIFYSLTNSYSAAVFVSYPERIHNLAMSYDINIVFIASMIIPYSWSLILFVVSFFMVGTDKQLSNLTSRLTIATLLACLVFYLFPARFSFIRPLTYDWTAFGYQFLQLTDKPFNQFPSLHVSYALILSYSLWDVVTATNSQKITVFAYRVLLSNICILIIISTVFTYQHHLLDILGGMLLASVVLLIVDKLHNMLVLKYLTVAIAGFILIAITGFFVAEFANSYWIDYLGLAIATYWLASFMILAYIYQINDILANKRWFKKTNQGKLTLSTWLKFAPLLFAYKLMAKVGNYYTKSLPAYESTKKSTSQISIESGKHLEMLLKEAVRTTADSKNSSINPFKVNHNIFTLATPRLSLPKFDNKITTPFSQLIVVDVAAEIASHFDLAKHHFIQQNQRADLSSKRLAIEKPKLTMHYLYLPLLDLQPFKIADISVLLDFFGQIDYLVADNQNLLNSNGFKQVTLINFHCVMGFSRSIAVEVLYLIYCDKLTIETYRDWITCHYPKGHLSENYLSLAVIKAIQKAN